MLYYCKDSDLKTTAVLCVDICSISQDDPGYVQRHAREVRGGQVPLPAAV